MAGTGSNQAVRLYRRGYLSDLAGEPDRDATA
jgi:hypothetical protein